MVIGAWTQVKEQTQYSYGKKLAAKGFAVLNVATVAAWLQHPSTTPGFYGGEEGVNARIKLSDEAAEKYAVTREALLVDAYNPDDPNAAMFFPIDYYSNPQRGAVPEWDNRFAVQSWKEWLTLNSIDKLADKITTPLIMVHSDESALPENVKKFYEQVSGR